MGVWIPAGPMPSRFMTQPIQGLADAVGTEVVYWVAADDRILWVNDAFDRFAAANGGRTLTEGAVLGQPLSRYIADPTTRRLHQMVAERVREQAGALVLNVRCDGPDRRRRLELHVRRLPAGVLEYTSRVIHLEARDPVDLLSAQDSTGPAAVTCGWCKRFRHDGSWMEVEDYLARVDSSGEDAPVRMTQATCARCADGVRAMVGAGAV